MAADKKISIWSLAQSNNYLELIKLAQQGYNIDEKDSRGASPLMVAAEEGHFETANALIDLGADVNSTDITGNTVAMIAERNGHVEILELLKSNGANTDYKRNSKNRTLGLIKILTG